MGLQRTWTTQVKVVSPKLYEWRTRSEAVIVLEQNGMLEAKPVSYSLQNSYEIELENIVSLLTVNTYREAYKISKMYNKLISKGIRVYSLNNLVEAVTILGDKPDWLLNVLEEIEEE